MTTKYYWRRRNAPAYINGPATIAEIQGHLRGRESTADAELVPATGQPYHQLMKASDWAALPETDDTLAVQPASALVDEFGQPFDVRCPICSESILSTARKCKHCGEWLPMSGTSASTIAAGAASVPSPGGSTGLVSWGVLILIVGLGWALVTLNMDTTVSAGLYGQERVHNIGLMSEKQNRLIASGIVAVVGVGLVVGGAGARRK